MPTLAIFTGDISRAQYESLREEVDWEHQKPNGGVFHCAGFDDNNKIVVADVWESPDALDAFVGDRLMPAMHKLHLSVPEVSLYEVHNINAYHAIEQHII